MLTLTLPVAVSCDRFLVIVPKSQMVVRLKSIEGGRQIEE
jgi:hypothetical protein